MGTVFSQGNFIGTTFSAEAEESLLQIFHAFNYEEPLQLLNPQSHVRQSGVWCLPSRQNEASMKISTQEHHRSRSLDECPSQERQNKLHTKPSVMKRQWQCQLCHTINETDMQICADCGSSKINVYVPCMDHKDTDGYHEHQAIASGTSIRSSSSFSGHRRKPSTDQRNYSDEENARRRSVLIAHKREVDEHIALRHIEQIRRTCLKSNSRFKDKNFPAAPSSLYINGDSLSQFTLSLLPNQRQLSSNSSSSAQEIRWLRPDQIVPQEWPGNVRAKWAIFRDPKPNDVLQGTLGDCWFITALSVLAEEPEYLMRVLVTKECNTEGIYCVRLCKDGEWTQIIIDDRLPCTVNGQLVYSQANRKQLWVPLIEKALAKLSGSYEAIIAGRCCEGLATVTGSPCETVILGRANNPDDKNVDLDKVWLKLFNARSQGFLMCAMCCNNLISKDEFEKCGLLNVHAYSLQDLKQSKDGKHKLVKLRNPWGGAYRWTGDWSDDSYLWSENPDLYNETLHDKRSKRDGVFWMPFISFVKYFECVDICKLRHNWYEVRDSANFYPASKMMQAYCLTLSRTTELDITLHRRISKNLRIQRSDVSLCVAVVSIEESSHGNYRIYSVPIISQRGQHKFVSTDGLLQPGTYVILPFLFNQQNKHLDNTEFNLAIHSSHVVDIQRMKCPTRIEREFLIKACIFHGEPVRTAKNSDENDASSDGVTVYELKKYWDGLVLLVENRHPSKYRKITERDVRRCTTEPPSSDRQYLEKESIQFVYDWARLSIHSFVPKSH